MPELWPKVWMSFWQDAADTWGRNMREFWMAEMHRTQLAMMNEAAHQGMQSWINAWTVLPFKLMGGTGRGTF